MREAYFTNMEVFLDPWRYTPILFMRGTFLGDVVYFCIFCFSYCSTSWSSFLKRITFSKPSQKRCMLFQQDLDSVMENDI